MNYFCILLGILFCAAGAGFALGKVHIHLTAWKTMPQEEKEKIRILPLCRNIGGMILLSGILFLLKGLCAGFSSQWFTAAMATWFLAAGLDVWFISKKGRYQK